MIPFGLRVLRQKLFPMYYTLVPDGTIVSRRLVRGVWLWKAYEKPGYPVRQMPIKPAARIAWGITFGDHGKASHRAHLAIIEWLAKR
jgi:hypothetical protein